MYLTFREYQEMGGTVDNAAFPRLEYRARKQIDRYTQDRVASMMEVPEAVKRCMTELINAMSMEDPTNVAVSPVLSGFSNDGYSESYAKPVSNESLQVSFCWIICEYLSTEKDDNGTPLLYAGVDA